MTNDELGFASVDECVAMLAERELSSSELVACYLDRIERYDDKLHAYVDVYREDALRAAQAADLARQSGHAAGPLHGIPVALKDLVEIEGRVTTGGSAVNRQRVSQCTATLVRRMLSAGMIVLGKTHTVEFAAGGWGTNQHMGTPWNPWDAGTHRAPGGSSAGSGVAVAAGLAPWAIGTDTGGSVRLPSSWCGLTGLKTTIGRISVHGVMPLSPTLDTPGPMTRSVSDAAHLFDVLQGPDRKDPLTLRSPAVDPFQSLDRGVEGFTLARLTDRDLQPVSTAVRDAYEETVTVFLGLGARVTEVLPPWSFADMGAAVGQIFTTEGYSQYRHLLDDDSLPLDEDVRTRMLAGKDLSADDYLRKLRDREQMKLAAGEILTGFDALLTPTTLDCAPTLASIDQTQSPAWFTRVINYLDRCAVVLPNGVDAAGLPTSVQIVCDGYREDLALRIASALQRATDWHRRRPSLSAFEKV